MNDLFQGTNAAGFIRFTRPDYQPKYVIDSDLTNPGEEVGMLVDVLQKRMKKKEKIILLQRLRYTAAIPCPLTFKSLL